MSVSPHRAIASAVLLALACAVPGLPAVASSATGTTSVVQAPAPDTFEVERTGGLTQLSDTAAVEAAGAVLYDSRNGTGAFAARETRVLEMFDGAPVTAPADATAAILNITAVSPSSSGWLTAWPSDRSRPTASTLNFVPGTPTPNLAIVQLTSSRAIRVMNGSGGTTHVLVSLRGWVRSNGSVQRPGSFTATDATRVIDTRQTGPAIPARGYRDVQVTGVGAPAGASAAALSLIAVNPSRAGHFIAHPSDTARPTSTALTYRVGAPRAALSIMRLSSTGKIRVWNMSGTPVHLVVDSFGWVAPGDTTSTPAGLEAITPVRTLDTRVNDTAVHLGDRLPLSIPGGDMSPERGRPSGVVLAITATGATASGYLRFDVADKVLDPLAEKLTPSILNFGRGETVTNTTYVALPTRGYLRVLAETAGNVHVVVDVVGLVRHRSEIAGRLVHEDTGAPIHPGFATTSTYGFLYPLAPTTTTGAYQLTFGSREYPHVTVCGNAATANGSQNLEFAFACIGEAGYPLQAELATGSRHVAPDIRVPRVGVAQGTVTTPGAASSSPSGANVILRRTDNEYVRNVAASATGKWSVPRVPAGTYIVTVAPAAGLHGETIDELPLPGYYIPPSAASDRQRISDLLAAGAETVTVTGGATTTVDEAQLLAPGTVVGEVVDPDGNLGNVTVTWRHESGFVVYTAAAHTTSLTRLVRPGSYTLCATEAGTTVCSGGSSTWQTATPIDVVSGVTSTTTVTLP